MSHLRLAVALVFAALYAVLMVRVIDDPSNSGALVAAAPVATLALTYLLGVETLKALRRNGRNGGNGGGGNGAET